VLRRVTYLGIGVGVVAISSVLWWVFQSPLYMSSAWLTDARRRY
jgi:hypothetical protein